MNLTRNAEQATRRSRLIETLLLDGVASRAIAAQKAEDPKAEPAAVVCWQQPGSASVGDRVYTGREGELQLVPAGVAQVLVDSGAAVLREPLNLPAWQRPSIANELRATASELKAAADALDPPAQPQAPTPEREDV